MVGIRTGAGSRRPRRAPARRRRRARRAPRPGSPPFRISVSRRPAASATRNAPIARAEPFSVCASAPASAGKADERADQAGRLRRKHRQHLALEAGIAQRHAPEMFDIDRTVIGSERRRWHPVNPFQMKRHGDNPRSSRRPIRRRSFGQPITEMVNGTFCVICRKFALFLAKSCLNWRRRKPKILRTCKALPRRAVNDD